MAKKKEEILRGGLNALFGGSTLQDTTDQEESKTPTMEVEPTTDTDETDLINSVEDEELRQALQARRNRKRGRPRKNHNERGELTNGYTRTSLILNIAKRDKIKEIAFRETLTMKEIFEVAMDKVIEAYEEKHGEIIPKPERYKGNINELF